MATDLLGQTSLKAYLHWKVFLFLFLGKVMGLDQNTWQGIGLQTSRDFVKFRCTRVHGYLVTLHTCLFTVLVLPQLGEGCGKCFARTQSRSQHFWNLILNWKFPTWVSNSLLTRGFPRSIRSLRIVGDIWYTIHWTWLGRSQGVADNARAVDRTLTS